MVEPWDLAYLKIGLDSGHLTPNYQPLSDKLVFCQAGITLAELGKALFQKGLSLSTHGDADGQRVVGAISTGTHGARINFGGMAEFVRGIHLVVPSGHIFVQPSSDQVVLPDFAETYLQGARLVNDDDLFYAAVIGLGCFGLIHGVVLETERLYKLRRFAKRLHYGDAKPFVTTLENIESLQVNGISSNPFHVEVTLNPYQLTSWFFKGADVILMDQVPLSDEEIQQAILERQRSKRWRIVEKGKVLGGIVAAKVNSFSNFFAGVLAWILSVPPLSWIAASIKRPIFEIILSKSIEDYSGSDGKQGREEFPNDLFSGFGEEQGEIWFGKSQPEMEISVSLERLDESIDLIAGVFFSSPIPAPIGIRYVKKSKALLSHLQYDVSATIAMPSIQDSVLLADTYQVFVKITEVLTEHSIPFALHMGKQHPMNDRWAANSYGANLEIWKRKREELLAENATMFCNKLASIYGLCDG